MKYVILTTILVTVFIVVAILGGTTSDIKTSYTKDASLNFFELDESLDFGSDKYNKALLTAMIKKGGRDMVCKYVFERADILKVTIWICFVYNNIYITWVESNADKLLVEKSVLISFDKTNFPIKASSVTHIVGKTFKRGIPIMPDNLLIEENL